MNAPRTLPGLCLDLCTRVRLHLHLRLRQRLLLPVLLCLPLLLQGGAALAQSQCVPQASGVPALSGPPNFLNPGAGEPNYWPRLDDPRWRGALARSFGSGASETASFRALRVGGASPALYLSWYVKVAPELTPAVDLLRVAFSTAGGTNQMLEVLPFTAATLGAGNQNAAAMPGSQTRTLVAGAWTNTAAEPAWLSTNTRVWLDKDPTHQQWAINMRVPLAAGFDTGLDLPADFRIAFELQVGAPNFGVIAYRLSDSVPLNNLNAVPASSTWPRFNIALAPGSVGCDKAISLANSDVGTTNVDAGNVPRPNRISLSGANTFFALPNNETGIAVPGGAISGTFRIANWGTQPDWNDIPNPTTSLWKQINSTVVSNGNQITATTKASIASGNALTFPWTPTVSERCELTGKAGIPANQTGSGVAIPGDPSCPNQQPTRRLHQCILVELSGGGLSYNPSSVYRNMDFVEASTFEREAEVSIAGVAPIAGVTQRDVYLYLQTLQMPKSVANPQPGQSLVDVNKVQAVFNRGDRQRVAATGGPAGGPIKVPEQPPLDGDFSTLSQLYPTYVVHAFRDTGKSTNIGGQARRVLQPQSSFGYYVHHAGPLAGWDTALEGAQLIAPNYYLVAAVPEGGSKVVTTRVVARENDGTRYAVWFALGRTVPHGGFSNFNGGGLSATLGFEYAFSSTHSAEITLSGHRFDGKSGGSDIDVTQFGINGKWYFSAAPLRWFATAGVASYAFDPGRTRGGLNAGLGLQYSFTPTLALDARYGFHHVFSNAPANNFSTLQLGLRFGF